MFALYPVSFPPSMSHRTAAFSFSPEFFLSLILLLTFFLFHISFLISPFWSPPPLCSLSLSLLSLSLTFLSCVVEVEPYVGTPRRRALYLCPCCAPEGNVNPVMFAAGQLCLSLQHGQRRQFDNPLDLWSIAFALQLQSLLLSPAHVCPGSVDFPQQIASVLLINKHKFVAAVGLDDNFQAFCQYSIPYLN